MSRFIRHRSRIAILAVLGLAVPAAIAYATVPDGNGVFHACVKRDGSIRMIDPDANRPRRADCHGDETEVSWNQGGGTPTGGAGPAGPVGATGATGATGAQGPAGAKGATGPAGATGAVGATGAAGAAGATGPQGATGARGAAGDDGATGATGAAGADGATGPAGATGATGPAGASGYQQVSMTGSAGPGATFSGTLACPTGKVAVGGGVTTGSTGDNVALLQSGPSSDGTSWIGVLKNNGTTTVRATLSAVCFSNVTTVQSLALTH